METTKLSHENRLLRVITDNISSLRLIIFIILGVALMTKRYDASLFGGLAIAAVILCLCQIVGLRQRALDTATALRKSGYTIFFSIGMIAIWMIAFLG